MSLTENLEKDKILQRMPHNLKTLEHLLEQNVDDFEQAASTRARRRGRAPRAAPQRSSIRRRKAVTLVEELSIRTQKVQPLMKKLEQICGADGRARAADRGRCKGDRGRQGGPGQPARRNCTT